MIVRVSVVLRRTVVGSGDWRFDNLSGSHQSQVKGCCQSNVLSPVCVHWPTEAIVSSVEAALSRQRELPESTKDNIRSRIASTIQSASLHDSNLTKDEQHALKRLRNDKDIVILLADKGRVTVVMDKTDYHDKMDALVNDKQTYEELKRDPTPAL